MPTEFYPVISEEPSSCFGCHERKVQHQIQLNASEFNGCPSELSLVSTVKWLQTPFLSNRRVEWWVYFYSIHGCRKAVHSFGGFFFPLSQYYLISPPCSRGWGWCLDDAPVKDKHSWNSVLPGVVYSAVHQCRLQYGSSSRLCDDMDVSLWTKPQLFFSSFLDLLTSSSSRCLLQPIILFF